MSDPLTTTGIVAAVYAIARAIEAGVRRIAKAINAGTNQRIADKKEAQLAGVLQDIQHELRAISESNIVTRVTLEHIEIRLSTVEDDVKYLRKRTGNTNPSSPRPV